VGECIPLQGPSSNKSSALHEGIALAAEEINNRGGILGKKVELRQEKYDGSESGTQDAFKKLLSMEDIVAVVGDTINKNALNTVSLAQTNKAPIIVPSTTGSSVGKSNDRFFRMCFSDDFQGSACAVFCIQSLKAKSAAILTEAKNNYSKTMASSFQKTFESKGGIVVTAHAFSSGSKDFRSQLKTIKSNGPDVIFTPVNDTDAIIIASQARELGINVPLIGGSQWQSQSELISNEKSLNGSYFSTHFSVFENRPSVDQFAKSFRAKYKKDPDAFAALGYDSMWILSEAIKKAGVTDGEAVSKALAQTTDYPGVTGRITINGQKITSKPAIIVKVKNGKLVPVVSINPEIIK
jgi:branched-chain amino acid transport system substrate-binding protein